MVRIKQVLFWHPFASEKGMAKVLIVSSIQNIVFSGFYLELFIHKAVSNMLSVKI